MIVSSPVQEEVMARLGDFFLRALSDGDLTVLASREASRLFQTWAEFDPQRGLGWLRPPSSMPLLNSFVRWMATPMGVVVGEVGGSLSGSANTWLVLLNISRTVKRYSFVGDRRNRAVNWEQQHRNLAKSVLAGSFRHGSPIRSTAADPFAALTPGRRQHLVGNGCGSWLFRRISLSDVATTGRWWPSGAGTWRPESWSELASLQRDAGRQIANAIKSLPSKQRLMALRLVAEHVGVFLRADLLAELQELFCPANTDNAVRRRLVAELEEELGSLRLADQNDWTGRAEATRRMAENSLILDA